MSYDDEGPSCRVTCLLSRKGVLDALRHKVDVRGDTATIYLQPDTPYWEAALGYDPEPVYTDEGYVRELLLEVGRLREPVVVNAEPEDLSAWLDKECEVWLRPEVKTVLGSQMPLDECAGLDGIFKAESALIDKFGPVIRYQRELVAQLLCDWRVWVQAEGIVYARALHERVRELRVEALGVSTAASHSLDILKSRLEKAIALAESSEKVSALAESESVDDVLADLMVAVSEVYKGIDEPEGRLRRVRARNTFLADAKEWALANGSRRLRMAVEAGVFQESLGVYRDERLQLEHPDWEWWDTNVLEKDIVNPEEYSITALVEARKFDRFARLSYVPNRGAVVIADFLDRTIVQMTSVHDVPF
jgi:hypothetical protein